MDDDKSKIKKYNNLRFDMNNLWRSLFLSSYFTQINDIMFLKLNGLSDNKLFDDENDFQSYDEPNISEIFKEVKNGSYVFNEFFIVGNNIKFKKRKLKNKLKK